MPDVKFSGLVNAFANAYFPHLKGTRDTLSIKLRRLVVSVRDCCVSENGKHLHMGNYWLLKTEPQCWSWDHQSANKGLSVWDGVRNHQAQKAMRNMKEGDLCFFYHTGKLKEVCGVVRVVKPFHPDPTDDTGKWGAVDVEEVLPLKSKVTLAQMKEDDEISDFLMFRQPRLSVVPVEEKVWRRVCSMGEVEPPLLDSRYSSETEGEIQATTVREKRASKPKAASVAKQDSKKLVGTRRKVASNTENEEPSKSTKEQSGRSKVKAPAAVKENKSKPTTGKKTSSAKSRTGIGKPAEPAKVAKKRVNQGQSDSDEEGMPSLRVEDEEPSKSTKKKQASKSKTKAAVVVEEDNSRATTARKSASAKSRAADVSGHEVRRSSQPAKVTKKRANQATADSDEDAMECPEASKKRASQAKPVSEVEKENAKRGKRPKK